MQASTLDSKISISRVCFNWIRSFSYYKNFIAISHYIVLRRLWPQLMSPNYCHRDLQLAYRSRHLTETALVKVVDNILVRIDEGKSHGPCQLRHIHSVRHKLLLERPTLMFSVCGSALQLTDSYLAGRSYTNCVVRAALASLVFDVRIRNLKDSGRNIFDRLCDWHWLPINSRLKY